MTNFKLDKQVPQRQVAGVTLPSAVTTEQTTERSLAGPDSSLSRNVHTLGCSIHSIYFVAAAIGCYRRPVFFAPALPFFAIATAACFFAAGDFLEAEDFFEAACFVDVLFGPRPPW